MMQKYFIQSSFNQKVVMNLIIKNYFYYIFYIFDFFYNDILLNVFK